MSRDSIFDEVRDSDAFTSDILIKSVERRASIPLHQSNFNRSDVLAFANEETSLDLVPHIMSHHEDFFLFEIEVDLEVGKLEYEIPSRAVGNKLRDVQYKIGDNYVELARTGIGARFEDNGGSQHRRFYVRNNKIVFLDTMDINTNHKLVFVFYMKPSRLVREERVGIITGIDRDSGEVVLSEIPEHFSTILSYDFYKSESPYNVLSINLSATTINASTNSVFFNPADIPSDLSVGDHLSKAGECIIPQVPTELHVMLAQMVACRVLEAQGDTQGLSNALSKLKQMKVAAGMLIDNRVEDSPRKIINRHGVLRKDKYRKY